jgi:hypothetical protein
MGNFFDNSGGSLISGAIGMIGGAISDRRNYKNQLKLMEQQQQYNKELGEINQGYAKEMAAINQQYALQAINNCDWSPHTLIFAATSSVLIAL